MAIVGSLTFVSRFTSACPFLASRYFSSPMSFVSPGALPGQSLTTVGSAALVENANASVSASENQTRDMGTSRWKSSPQRHEGGTKTHREDGFRFIILIRGPLC